MSNLNKAEKKDKLPDIYNSKKKQNINQRNAVIDEYIKSLDDKNWKKQNDNSVNSDDDKDPFSSHSLKNIKSIKSTKNKLILPNFKKREKLKSESNSEKRDKNFKNKKNYSDNNIIHKANNENKMPNIIGINNIINSKWTTRQSSYNNHINYSNKINNKSFSIYNKTNNQNNYKNYKNIYNNRNFTANSDKNKKILKKENNSGRINSTLNTNKIVENKRQIYEKLIKERNNPYGLYWVSKMFRKNKGEKIELSKKEFSNGVPMIKLLGKKDLNKREIKKKLNNLIKKKKEEENKFNKIINAKAKLSEEHLNDEYNLPNDILEQFNQNKKNFFKMRTDIIERPDEEDQILEK